MTQESLSAPAAAKPIKVILEIAEPALGSEERGLRDLSVQRFWDRLVQPELLSAAEITPLKDRQVPERRTGLQIALGEPERVTALIKSISTALAAEPTEIRLTTVMQQVWLQIKTKSAEEILSLLPVLDTLHPAKQLFQARAAAYAMRGGEFSPVEQANLELLGHRLKLSNKTTETITAYVLGPYRDRQAKLQKYQQVLQAELDRESPPSAETRRELRKLYQALGLSQQDVASIDEDHIPAERASAEQTAEIASLQAENARLQAENDDLKKQAASVPTQEPQNWTETYRQEVQGAFAQSLFPTAFDQGRLEQLSRLGQLDNGVTRAIQREVTDDRYGPIDSNSGLDHSRLRALLWQKQWEAADKETERLILSASSGRDMQPLDDSSVLQLDCIDICTINALWERYSQGKFGFAAQHRVYAQKERRADEFLNAVGWQDSVVGIGNVSLLTRRMPYRELQFDLEAPAGHLPTWRWGTDSLEGNYAVREALVDAFFLHLERCLPTLEVLPPVDTSEGVQD